MVRWACGLGFAFILGNACKMEEEPPFYECFETTTSCRIVSGWSGYQRACSTTCVDRGIASNRGDDEDRGEGNGKGSRGGARDGEGDDEEAASGSAAPEEPPTELGPAAPPDLTRYSAFDIPCERDSQCGPGQCKDGNCYYGCQSDAQCGSGDRCSVESGVRVCQPDPNPRVECTRSAQCDDGFTCLNGACRQTCTSTPQCTNVLDRCGSGVCVPDRRPLGECVLNSECAVGLVCLDGACVPACPAQGDEDANVCLAEPPGAAPGNGPSDEAPTVPAGGEPGAGEGGASPPGDSPAEEAPTEEEPPPDEGGAEDDGGDPSGDGSPDAGVPFPDIQ